MKDAIEAWHAEHVQFNRLLGELKAQVDAFHAGGRPDYERMLEIIAWLRDFGDRLHHPREEAAFERLAQRCPELRLELARLRQEHQVIARAGEALATLLSAALDGALIQRAQIEIAAAMYLVYYGNHIAHEEEEILGRAAQALTPEDWAAVKNAA